jgi:hypothetical protein
MGESDRRESKKGPPKAGGGGEKRSLNRRNTPSWWKRISSGDRLNKTVCGKTLGKSAAWPAETVIRLDSAVALYAVVIRRTRA